MNRTLLAGLLVPVTGLAAGAAVYAGVAAVRGRHTATPAAASTTGGQTSTAEQAVLISPKNQAQNLTGYLTGYANGTLRFQTATWIPGGVDNGHYKVGSRIHSLPLATNPAIRSAVGICSNGQVTMDRNGNADKACSTAQLSAALQSGNRPYAALHVDSTGHVTSVLERYVP